jgi:hypothetical protein
MEHHGDLIVTDDAISDMFSAAALGDDLAAAEAASRLLGMLPADDTAALSGHQLIGLAYARALDHAFAATALALNRQPKAAAEAFRKALEYVREAPWQDHPGEPWALAFRRLDLQARISIPLNEAGEALLLADVRSAVARLEDAEPVFAEVRSLFDPDTASDDPALRLHAFSLATAYFFLGSIVFMACADRGKYLDEADFFFTRMEELANASGTADLPEGSYTKLLNALAAYSSAAKLHVDAGRAAAERRFADARDLLTESRAAFRPVRLMFTEDMGPFFQLKDSLMQRDEALEIRIAAFADMAVMERELEAARHASVAGRDRISEMEAFKEEVILSFARQNLNIRTEIRNENDINVVAQNIVEQSLFMQDRGLDQIADLLKKLPQDPEVEKVKADVEDAKADNDLSTKVEKVAKVLVAAGKVVDAAKDFVPYGPQVIGALKAIFALVPSRGDAGRARRDAPLDPTTMV